MVDANDDPATPAYKQIEEIVESQVCVHEHLQCPTLQTFCMRSRLCWLTDAIE